MGMSDKRWTTVTPSQFPWEQEALAFLRDGLPDHEPWRAWTTFEFIAQDGSLNEVDLLVLGPTGFYLIEIKHWAGKISGDSTQWLIEEPGRIHGEDNPLRLANLKAKRFRSLLERQQACRECKAPFVEPLVFLSNPEARLALEGPARTGICLRDRAAAGSIPARPGILAALLHREGANLTPAPKSRIDRPVAKTVTRAIEQAGIRPSQSTKRFGDYELDGLLFESPRHLYQDFRAHHRSFPGIFDRLRLYPVARGVPGIDRETLIRAARREFEIIRGIAHPGILKAKHFIEHDLGPALVFDFHRHSIRLDHYLAQYQEKLGIDARLELVRKIAEGLAYAHEKRVIHRALSPQSVLVLDPESPSPRTQLFNWQTGARSAAAGAGSTAAVSGTAHLKDLVEDASTVYLAPEALHSLDLVDQRADVFSLGAVAYHIFTGQSPAADWMALHRRLEAEKGLDISSVLNGAGVELRELILNSTRGDIELRFDTVADFLKQLERVEDELTSPDEESVDPLEAKARDRLEGGWIVKSRLGTGSTAVVLLVEKDGHESVLKISAGPEHDTQIRAEGEVLKSLHHEHIIEFLDLITVSGRPSIRMKLAGDLTLAVRLRSEGPLLFDLLQRFGENLLETLDYLEKKGVAHRDIKPDNLGIAPRGRSEELHLVLFDFSLSKISPDNIRAGTTGYLEPFLINRRPPQWDAYAERYAAAVTLYEMATGTRPRWGDGISDPALLECEATIEADRFEPAVREGLTKYFQRALRRDPRLRFDNAEQMLLTWREIFIKAQTAGTTSRVITPAERQAAWSTATLATHVVELLFSARALSVLDRLGVDTVADLLALPLMRIRGMRGVGHRTRLEIVEVVQALRPRFPDHPAPTPTEPPGVVTAEGTPLPQSLDLVVQLLLPRGRASAGDRVIRHLLGLTPHAEPGWRTQAEVAQKLGIAQPNVSVALKQARERWRRQPAMTALRETVAQLLDSQGGVAAVSELVAPLLAARGSTQEEPLRSLAAWAALRAAVEAETPSAAPRFALRRSEKVLLLSRVQTDGTCPLADFAVALGQKADGLAGQDPLPSPTAVLDALRSVPAPQGDPIPDARLVRLSAAASRGAAASSRLELYPRNMEARRALSLAQNAFFAAGPLTAEDIQQRVASRYPEADPLPGRPLLDTLLAEAGLDLEWDPAAAEGRGAFRMRETLPSVTTFRARTRLATSHAPVADSPEVREARRIEARLETSLQSGGFLALAAPPRQVARAEEELSKRFPVNSQSLEALFLEALREEAQTLGVDWKLVLRTDAQGPQGHDWPRLTELVHRAMHRVEAVFRQKSGPLLATRPGLFVRFKRIDLLERLRDLAGTAGGPSALWLLFPADAQSDLPMIDGEAFPVVTANQWARLTEGWLANAHRAGGGRTPLDAC